MINYELLFNSGLLMDIPSVKTGQQLYIIDNELQ